MHDFACYCKQAGRKFRIVAKRPNSTPYEAIAHFETLGEIRITQLALFNSPAQPPSRPNSEIY